MKATREGGAMQATMVSAAQSDMECRECGAQMRVGEVVTQRLNGRIRVEWIYAVCDCGNAARVA